jgi:VRR-NUC domain
MGVAEISELSFHILAVDALRKQGSPDWLWFHCPNGEARDPRQTAKFRAMGVRRGIPDLVLVDPTGVVRFLEFKKPSASLNEDQEKIMFWSIKHGISHAVARSLNDALMAFRTWGVIPEEG